MINFRYHVVSLTAVFLSLAVGLVLGSTVLNGPMLDALSNQVSTLGRDNSQLREQVSFLEEEASREEAFATEAAPMLLDGALTDRRVAVVVLPTGEDYAEGVTEMLALAGATVTGTVQVTDKFTHPVHRLEELLDLAHQVVPESVDAERLPALDGVEASAALWAAVLLDRPADADQRSPGGEPELAAPDDGEVDGGEQDVTDPDGDPGNLVTSAVVPDEDRRAVLSAFVAMDFLAIDEQPEGTAEVVVVVSGLPVTDNDADQRNRAMLTTIEQFDLAGEVVVAAAGPSGAQNVVGEVRADPALSASISTVDNAATPQGQVGAALAVAEQLTTGVGHYGIGGGVDGLLPARPVE